jgi:hypothetical protein
MRTRWEYLTVSWNLVATAPTVQGEGWKLEGALQVSRPAGSGVETRRYDASQSSTLAYDLLNELGAEGWELVSHVVERSTVAPAQGYETAGVPIATMQVFKRPAE